MPAIQNQKQVNAELQRLGFGTLKDPTLPDQFAAVIRDHAHFRGILMHIPQGMERANWYQALSTKVRFKAKPLADYEMESRILAEQNQLPTYDPKTLEVKEFKPQEFRTRRDDVICELCDQGEAVTGDGKWHNYGTPAQVVCATCPFVSDGYPVAPSRPVDYDGNPNLVATEQAEQSSKLAKVANEAIDRDLREAQATQQLSLVCRVCTYEQKFRVKKRIAAYKIARQYGWTIESKGTTALCRACSAKVIQ